MSDQAETVVDEAAEAATEATVKDAVVEETVVEETVVEETVVEETVVEETIAEEVAVQATTEEAVAEEEAAVEAVAEPVVAENVDEEVAATDADSGTSTEEESATASTDEASPDEPAAEKRDDVDGKRVVRVLSIGQEVPGTVKRISDFGAFVDIGVGRDGLLHVSELSIQRVNKVSDVLSKGQEITVWIKQLDRERNRISLTMISPDTKTIRDLKEGELVEGSVTRMLPYGVFIDIGVGREALLHVREMGEGYIKHPEDILKMGETVEARIISVSRRRNRIDLSIKGLRPEPESEQTTGAKGAAKVEEEEVYEDQFEEVEVLSAIELAFKKAMSGGEEQATSKQARKERKKKSRTSLQDDIIARTLSTD